MRTAVVVVGKHYAGKSKTIRKYATNKLGIGEHVHKFNFKGQKGYILSQTFEEADRDIEKTIADLSAYDLLIVAARPAGENPSFETDITAALQGAGYTVRKVTILRTSNESYYQEKADEVIAALDGEIGIAQSAASA